MDEDRNAVGVDAVRDAPQRDGDAVPPDVEFAVVGDPVPEGSTQLMPLGGKRGGKPIIVPVASAALRDWRRQIVRSATLAMRGKQPLQGPVAMSLQFVMRRPQKMPTGRLGPTVPPDLDKLTRAVGDALSGTKATPVGVCMENDAQIVEFRAPFKKRYTGDGEVPGVIIRLWALGPQQMKLEDR